MVMGRGKIRCHDCGYLHEILGTMLKVSTNQVEGVFYYCPLKRATHTMYSFEDIDSAAQVEAYKRTA